MASNSLLLLHLFVFSVFHAAYSLHLPVTKHAVTNQYLTRIRLGSEPVPATLVVDISSPSLWLVDCVSGSPVPSLSIPCSSAGDPTQPPPPPATTCTVLSTNPVSKLAGRGELVSDSISLRSLNGQSQFNQIEDFLFICAPKFLANGFAGGVRGVFGLGRASRISPVFQFAHQLNLPGKFSLCLPGKNGDGMIFAGKAPDRITEITKSLVYTPLLERESGSSDEYYIRVKSIKISNKKLSLPGSNQIRAKLSTIDPSTKLASDIYKTFIKAFERAGDALNLARVETREPYGLCYGAAENTVEAVPGVDLVLQSEMVRWRINGRNSMVDMGDGVMCLGFVDGRSDLDDGEIVIGAHQLEDVLMEFDLRSGMLGFSSSLLDKATSCGELSVDAAARSRDL
ncbi:hypothetical protein V2J09_014152 [Rumex salicifolius]